MRRCSPWWVGDAILYGEDCFGEKFSQGVDVTRLSAGTLANIVTVCRRIPSERRRAELSFSHHVVVTHLSPEEQIRWLARAIAGDEGINGERQPWSVSRLRSGIRAERGKEGSTSHDPVPEGVTLGGDEESPLERALPELQVGARFRLYGGIYLVTSIGGSLDALTAELERLKN
jgi:hypothetical protein